MCPMGCGDYEAPLHYLQCTKNPNEADIQFAIRDITRWLKKQDMAPVLVCIVTCILHKFTQRKSDKLEVWNFTNEQNSVQLNALVCDQAEIGWENFFKGRVTKEWSSIKGNHYDSLDLPKCTAYKTGKWWTSDLICQII